MTATAAAPPRPAPSTILAENIPAELRAERRWVCWRYELRDDKWTKVPVNSRTGANASSTAPATWGTFAEARAGVQQFGLDGIGFMLGDGWAGLDVDGCRDPATGIVDAPACHLIQRLWSYAEVSPSQRGVKVLMRGSLPPGRRRVGNVELYDCDRFFTITGRVLPFGPTAVADRAEALTSLHADLFPQQPPTPRSRPPAPAGSGRRPDDVVIARIRESAQGAKFDRLMAGDTSEYGGDWSRADEALCSILVYWTNRDPLQVESIWRQSALANRAKWDRADYRERTITAALDFVAECYAWPEDQPTFTGGSQPDAPADVAACQAQLAAALKRIAKLEAQNDHLQQQRDTYRSLARRRGRLYGQALRRIRVQQQLADTPYFDGRIRIVQEIAHEVGHAGADDHRGDGMVRVRRWRVAKRSGKGEGTVTKTVDSLVAAGLAVKTNPELPAAPGEPPEKELCLAFPGLVLPANATPEARTLAVEEYIARRAPVAKRTSKDGNTHGGDRTDRPSCRRCGPTAEIEETRTRKWRCTCCDTILESQTRTVGRYHNDVRAPFRLVTEAWVQDEPTDAVEPDEPSQVHLAPEELYREPQVQDEPRQDTDGGEQPLAWFPRPTDGVPTVEAATRWLMDQVGRRVRTRDGTGVIVEVQPDRWRALVRFGDADRWYSFNAIYDPPEVEVSHAAD